MENTQQQLLQILSENAQLRQAFQQAQTRQEAGPSAPPPAAAEPAPVSKRPLVEKLNNVPKFSGERKEKLESWWFQVTQYLKSFDSYPEAEKLLFAGGALTDGAAEWWRLQCTASPPKITTLKQLITGLRKQYTPVAAHILARQALSKAVQRPKDSVDQYTRYMRDLFSKIPNISEDEQIERYMKGLKNELYEKVFEKWRENEDVDLDEVVQYASDREAMLNYLQSNRRGERPAFSGHRTFGQHPRRYDNGTGPAPMDINAVQAVGASRGQRVPASQLLHYGGDGCWNCGKKGHLTRQCRLPIQLKQDTSQSQQKNWKSAADKSAEKDKKDA